MTHDSTLAFTKELAFMADVAVEASDIAARYFRHDLSVEDKADCSPVTIADREIEAMMRARIMARFPHHGIYGEEEAPYNLAAKLTWVIDPIDGTKAFVTGNPMFGTLMALLDDGRPVIGQIDMPQIGERWQGGKGMTSVFNGAPCQTSGCQRLEDAYLYTTNPFGFDPQSLLAFNEVSARVKLTRYGGDCHSYGLLASGHCDLVIETGLQPFDYLSLVPIVEGAQGVITDWEGRPLGLNSLGDVIAAATPQLHEAALIHLRGQAPRS